MFINELFNQKAFNDLFVPKFLKNRALYHYLVWFFLFKGLSVMEVFKI